MAVPSAQLSQSRLAAYTGVRSDIFGLVPETAMSILDLGCADGSLAAALKRENPARWTAGVEYSPVLAQTARERLDQVLQGDLNRPELLQALGGKKFDCVICADVLEHLQQPNQLLQHLQNHLAPNACIVVSLPNIRHLSALIAIFWQGSFPRRQRGIFDDTHLRWFTLRDGEQMLTDAGLKVEARTYNLRWGDQGGGRANRALIKLLGPHAHRLSIVREFLTYQVAMRARCMEPGKL